MVLWQKRGQSPQLWGDFSIPINFVAQGQFFRKNIGFVFFFSSGYSTSGMHITEALLGDKLDNKVNSFFYFRKTCTLLRLCPIDLPSVKPNTNNTVSTPKWGDYSVFLNGIESTFTEARIMTAIMWHHNSRHRRQYRIADEGIYAALGTWFTLLSLNYIDPSIRNMWPYKTC